MMTSRSWSSRACLLPLLALLCLWRSHPAGAAPTMDADSLLLGSSQSPADRRTFAAVSWRDTTAYGIRFHLHSDYNRFHNLTTAHLKQANRQGLLLTRPVHTAASLLLWQQSDYYHERSGRELFDGTLLAGGRLHWHRTQLDAAGGVVSRLRDTSRGQGPALRVSAERDGPLTARLLAVMENPGHCRERQARLTGGGRFQLTEQVSDQLGVLVDYDQSTQALAGVATPRRALREELINDLAYRVNRYTTVFAKTSLALSRLEQAADNHDRLGFEQEFRHHYHYGRLQLRTTFALQRRTAEATLSGERRFSGIERNLLRLESEFPLWFGDSLQLTGMVDKLSHDTDLYGEGAQRNEVTDRDYRDERQWHGSLRYCLRTRWLANDLSFIFRSRQLNYIYADQSGNNHDAVNLLLEDKFRYPVTPRLALSGRLDMVSSWRHYRFESATDLRSYIERGFHGGLSCEYSSAPGDTIRGFLAGGYEDGGLYDYEQHVEYRSHSATDFEGGCSWLKKLVRDWRAHAILQYLQRRDWDYSGSGVADRDLRRNLQQLNGRLELKRGDHLLLQTGAVYSWGVRVESRLDLVYQLRWRISF